MSSTLSFATATTALPDWPRATDLPPAGRYRQCPADFIVTEQLGFEPEGHGEHLWLWVEKRELNTMQVVDRLARLFDVQRRNIGFSGLKDKTAITRQWISLPMPDGGIPDAATVAPLEAQGIRVLSMRRHPRKLKRGTHRFNHFSLVIGFDEAHRDDIMYRWTRIVSEGVPNYFGSQRFGFQGRNIEHALQLFAKGWRKRDDKQGIFLSAARSLLFNQLLAQRVALGNWNRALPGEVFNLDGTASQFYEDTVDATLHARLARLDIHPTGPMWGKGPLESQHDVATLEQAVADNMPRVVDGLITAGLTSSRRALRLRLREPSFVVTMQGATLEFSLVKGAFATSVLRELIDAPGL